MGTEIVGRLAPSPSGWLHMGNLLAMLLAWLDCRAQNGRLLFRMEDLDPDRSKPAFAAAMADDLRWLGLDWDGGWPDPAFAQSRRTARYEDAFRRLRRAGLLYPCRCTRAQRLAGLPCPCARLSRREQEDLLRSGSPCAWKLRAPDTEIAVEDGHYGPLRQNLAREGDFTVRRADGVFTYPLAVCVDDGEMGVNRVVRGRDLLEATPRQVWLIQTLGGEAPSYCHTPLLVDGPLKLSKRRGSRSM